ncbi:unnamed protein product [Candida verbasci]|uniref:Proteasome activator subunit 4 n=1 Tax=Candida verbasci TaxID=1227364 RepID=A0A9W4XAC6_9ASCO|nr:unnamed protein product [Candida verbasci]
MDRRPSYNTIAQSREEFYNLDYPNTIDKLKFDVSSRFYSRSKQRTLNLTKLLPYNVESEQDKAKFLSHIVSHLYIAIKTLDIQGVLSVSAKDLANIKEISDVDMTMETDLFEGSYDSDESMESEVFDEEGENDTETTSQHKKSPKSAAVVNVRTWTHELLVWMKMKYDMPISLRISLVRVYYALCLTRGQSINMKLYVKVFEILTKNYRDLYKYGLRLEHEDLLQEFLNLFPSVNPSIINYEKKDQKQLSRLATRASYFFDKSCLPYLYKQIGCHFSSTSLLVMTCFSMLPNFFNESIDENDIRYYIGSFFYMWMKINKIQGFDAQVTSRLGAMSMAALAENVRLGEYGIYTKEQMEFLFNTLLNSLSIMNRKYSSHKLKYFHGYASAIVYSISSSSNEIIQHLKTLVNAIESYVHPSNTGDWTRPISKLVIAFVYQFHKRYNSENQPKETLFELSTETKLTKSIVKEFVNIFLPVVKIGIQSKSESATDDYIAALQLLGLLDPEYVLENTLLDIYESLEGVIATHRVSIALRALGALSRVLVSTPIYRVHVTRLLSLAIPGIDSNDLGKTVVTFEFFSAIANYTPIYDLTEGEGNPSLALEFTQEHLEHLRRKIYNDVEFPIDEQLEIDALKSSTSAYRELISSLLQKLFTLFENLPDPEKSSSFESDLSRVLPKYLFIIFESISDDLFKGFKNEFFDFIFNNTYHLASTAVADICGGIVKRAPKCFKKHARLLMEKIREEIDENGAGKSQEVVSKDHALEWYLTILGECVGNAGSQITSMEDLRSFSFYLMDNVRGVLSYQSNYFINQVLQTVTKIRLLESRLISPEYQKNFGITEKCWGGFWNQDFRFSKENTTFQWFIPDEKDVTFAIDFFNSHVSKALDGIKGIIDTHDSNIKATTKSLEDLKAYLASLSYCLSGVSFLLDPCFEEYIPKSTESIQQRLQLLKQIRENKGSTQKDIVYDMEQIINDLEESFSPDTSKIEETPSRPSSVELDNSPVESGRNTPQIEGFAVNTNPVLTFRERSLYTSNYFFKEKTDLYFKVHKIRSLIGKCLQVVYNFLIDNFGDNIKVFESYLQVIQVWFANVGRERSLGPSNATISYAYLCYTQTINRMRKPFTRIAIGARLESYQSFRLAFHATPRTETSLDKALLEKLTKLSVSTYSNLAAMAQSNLIEAIKRVTGAYNIIVKTGFKELEEALKNGKPKKIESCLKLFHVKKIKSKLQLDVNYIQRYVDLLHQCFKVDDSDVQKIANSLYSGVKHFFLPSSVCIIKSIEMIRPPDPYIDLEIQALQLAKDKKRRQFFETWEKLQDKIINYKCSHWKTTLINLELLEHLQSHFSIQTRKESLNLLLEEAINDHPVISRLALQGITRGISKLIYLSSYDYDLKNAFDLYYKTQVRTIDTSDSYFETFKKEMNKPTYFVDTKPDVGWLFWNSTLTVSDTKKVELKPKDFNVAQLNIDKEWFSKVVKSWITDAETHSSFQIGDVFLSATVTFLISYGWIPLKFTELFEIIEQVYVFDEKSSHLVVSELISGILIASKYLTPEMEEQRDNFIAPFLTRIFDDVSPDTSGVWTVFLLWNPSHTDSRRYKNISDIILTFKSSDSPFKESSRLSYIRSMISSISWRLGDPEKYLDLCLQNLNHRYATVRNEVGNLMAVLSLIYYVQSIDSSEKFLTQKHPLYRDSIFIANVGKIFDQVEIWRKEVIHLSPQEILNTNYIYAATTVLQWLRQQLNTNFCIMFEQFLDYVVPFLLNLIDLKEVCQLGNIDPITVLKKLSQIPFTNLEKVINILSISNLNLIQTLVFGEFMETVYFKNLFKLTLEQREKVFELCNSRLSHKSVEVREAAAESLSGLIHISPNIETFVNNLSKEFTKELDKTRRNKSKGFTNDDIIKLHGATLGLGALVHAFAFQSPPPPWVPEILTTIANKCTGLPGVIGKTAKESLGKFKKNRQDSWHIDSKIFSEEQIQDLEGVLWKSYFI